MRAESSAPERSSVTSAEATSGQRRTERRLAGCEGLFRWIIEHHLRTAISQQNACLNQLTSKGGLFLQPYSVQSYHDCTSSCASWDNRRSRKLTANAR